jgi:hypothetical protein
MVVMCPLKCANPELCLAAASERGCIGGDKAKKKEVWAQTGHKHKRYASFR